MHINNLEQQIHDLKQVLFSMREERSAIMCDKIIRQWSLDKINERINELLNKIAWFECKVKELKNIEKNLNFSIIKKENDINSLIDKYKREEHELAEITSKTSDAKDKYDRLLDDIKQKETIIDWNNVLLKEQEDWKQQLIDEITEYNNHKEDIEKKKEELKKERRNLEREKYNLKLFENNLNIKEKRLKKYKEELFTNK